MWECGSVWAMCVCENSNPHLTFGSYYKHQMAELQPAAMDKYRLTPFSIFDCNSFQLHALTTQTQTQNSTQTQTQML